MKEQRMRYLRIAVRAVLLLSPLICLYGFAPETVTDVVLMTVRLAIFFGMWMFTLIRCKTLAGFGFGFWVYMTVMYIFLIAAVLINDYSPVGAVLAFVSVLPTMPFNMLIGLGEKLLGVYSMAPVLAFGAISVIFLAGFVVRLFKRP